MMNQDIWHCVPCFWNRTNFIHVFNSNINKLSVSSHFGVYGLCMCACTFPHCNLETFQNKHSINRSSGPSFPILPGDSLCFNHEHCYQCAVNEHQLVVHCHCSTECRLYFISPFDPFTTHTLLSIYCLTLNTSKPVSEQPSIRSTRQDLSTGSTWV